MSEDSSESSFLFCYCSGVATDCFEAVGWTALERLDLPTACSAFAAAQRSDLVFSLCSLEDVEEIAALKGHLKGLLLLQHA